MKNALVWFLAPIILFGSNVFASDPVLVIIDNKLVKAESVVSPKVVIQGADVAVPLGEIVILQAQIRDEVPAYVKKREYAWNITEAGYTKRSWVDGDKVVFGAGVKATKLNVELQVKLTYEVGSEQLILISEQKVDVIVGSGPTPDPPGPNPPDPKPPGPAPDPSPNLIGLGKLAYDWAIAVGPKEKASAAILAKGFRDIGVQAGHSTELKDIRSILVETKKLNNANLTKAGIDPKTWDAWGNKLQEYLYEKYNTGELKTVEDYKKSYDQIDKGLSAIGISSLR